MNPHLTFPALSLLKVKAAKDVEQAFELSCLSIARAFRLFYNAKLMMSQLASVKLQGSVYHIVNTVEIPRRFAHWQWLMIIQKYQYYPA